MYSTMTSINYQDEIRVSALLVLLRLLHFKHHSKHTCTLAMNDATQNKKIIRLRFDEN